MYHLLFYLSILTFFVTLFTIFRDRIRKSRAKSNLLVRFKRRSYSKSRILEKLLEKSSNKLLLNPEQDIKMYQSDQEEDLREKANIHRTRLSKHGKSKLNGETYYRGPKGGIFILNNNGKKKYI